MKILLCYKNAQEMERREQTAVPVGLFWIGAALKKAGHDVLIENFSTSDWDEVKAFIEQEKPDIVAAALTHYNRWQILKLAGILKRIDYHLPFIVGGEFASGSYEEIFNHGDDIDVVVVGEGEETIVELVGKLKNATVEELTAVKGIAFKGSNDALFKKPSDGVILTDPREKIDINSIPVPPTYFTYNQIIMTRGCTDVRRRTAESVANEINTLYDKGVREFKIVDALSTSDKKTMIALCNAIKDKKIAWKTKADLATMDKDVLQAMKQAGCYEIEYSIRSDDYDVQKVKDTATETRQAGIPLALHLTIGNPEDSNETIKNIVGLLSEIKPQRLHIEFRRLFPGKKLFDQEVKAGGIDENLWFSSIEHVPVESIYKWKERRDSLHQWMKILSGFYRDHHKNYAFSIDKLTQLIQQYPSDVWALNAVAKYHARKGEFEEAGKILEKASKANPGFYETFLNRGVVAEKQEDYGKAEEAYLQAIQIDITNPIGHKNLGNVYVKQGKIKQAKQCYEQAVKYNHSKYEELLQVIDSLDLQLQGAAYEFQYN